MDTGSSNVPGTSIAAAVLAWSLTKLLGSLLVAKARKLLFEKVGTVDALFMYPMKSCGAMKVLDAFCSEVGLSKNGATDRHWMTVDSDNSVVCMMEHPKLTVVRCQCVDEDLVVSAPGMPDLRLPLRPDLRTAKTFIKVFDKQPIRVVDCGEAAAKWMSEFLGEPVKIVYSRSDIGTRSVFERKRRWKNTARSSDKTVFGYLTSYMMTSSASLKEVNDQLDKPVDMVNFRPNIAIGNSIPFDEDNWAELRIGENVLFHSVEPCRRCTITTIDPDSGAKDVGGQPWKLLKSYRCRPPYGNAPIFGNYMSVDVPGHIKVGDPVYVLRKKDT